MINLPHFILELANFHGGSSTKIFKLLSKFSKLNYDNLRIKFQAFKFDKIALSDYSWYKVYKELFISKDKWKKIIGLAYEKFNSIEMKKSGWENIYDYLKERDESKYGFDKIKITHVWTQNKDETIQIAKVVKIENTVDRLEDMIPEVNGVIVARDDYKNHFKV